MYGRQITNLRARRSLYDKMQDAWEIWMSLDVPGSEELELTAYQPILPGTHLRNIEQLGFKM